MTGDEVVDEATERLRDIASVPIDERPDVFDRAHRSLQDRLADLEG